MNLMYESELYHHGIKGMKWGVRRFQDKNGRLTSAGRKRYLAGGSKIRRTNLDEPIIQGSFGLRMKNKKCTIQDDLKNTNPNFNTISNFFSNSYSMNCGNCCMAFEMRQRGFDVEASGNKKGLYIGSITKFFDGITKDSIAHPKFNVDIGNMACTAKKAKLVEDKFKETISDSYPNNSRGMMYIPYVYGAHFVNWMKDSSGNVTIMDAQNPKLDLKGIYRWFYEQPNMPTTMIRLDNLKPNKNITQVINDRGIKKMMDYNMEDSSLLNLEHPNTIEDYIKHGEQFMHHYALMHNWVVYKGEFI